MVTANFRVPAHTVSSEHSEQFPLKRVNLYLPVKWQSSRNSLDEALVLRALSTKIFNFKGCDFGATQFPLPHLEAIISLAQHSL